MFRNPTLKIILGIGLCSLGGAMLYAYFKNKDEEDELDAAGTTDTPNKKKIKEMMLKLVIPNDVVPVIIGRSGANIKIIEEKTGTVIRFREKDDNNQFCEIRGVPKAVEKAKLLIAKEMQRPGTVREEIYVPQSATGKIIGRCGEALQEICRKSLAKVSVESGDRSSGNITRLVTITGNRDQVNIAKKLIEEKVNEDAVYRKSLEENEQKREPRRSPTTSISSTHSSIVSIASQLPNGEKINLTDDERQMEVYVSAIASPAKFWLQLIGPQSSKLDKLVDAMTEYYNNENNQALHKISEPYLGQIVAALFKLDGKWYRAEIVAILPNDYNPRDVVLDLYFVDYGDSEYVAPHEVFELRSDFLTLRFQAIECYLAHVKPALTNDQEMWDQQSIARFEELTHVASWKKLISRVVTYKERQKAGNHSRREGSPVPGVELFDASEGTDVNIAHALISQGYAVPDFPSVESTSDVLRLDGGDSSNPPQNVSGYIPFNKLPENISSEMQNFNLPPPTTTTNENLKQTNNFIQNNRSDQEEPHTNGNHLEQNHPASSNHINGTQKLLQSEKMNGNGVPSGGSYFTNHNGNHWLQS